MHMHGVLIPGYVGEDPFLDRIQTRLNRGSIGVGIAIDCEHKSGGVVWI